MQIPFEQLEATTLRAIIEHYVLEEGTDYGHQDYMLEEKVRAVMHQLETGKAVVLFDPEEESCSIKLISQLQG